MKKHIILLIVPLLFFSIGCDKDEVNFPDYSELILGHWELTSYTTETNTLTTIIDPVFGTETTTNNSSNISLSPPFVDNGQLRQEENYNNGVFLSKLSWFPNGMRK